MSKRTIPQEDEKKEEPAPQDYPEHKKARRSDDDGSDDGAPPPIPVTILSGFLGSGKTTLLKHILSSEDHGLRIAVVVNDMAELNIDGRTIEGTVSQVEKEVIKLDNGCICCTLRGDLIREIDRIRAAGDFDYVLIESTGIAEPQQVAESFCADPQTEAMAEDPSKMLWNTARLDTCVTVVDAVHFAGYLSSLKRFQEVFQDGLDEAEEEEGQRSISELMVEQVEFANVILLNKVDLVSKETIGQTKQLLRTLNPKARLLESSHGKIDPTAILDTGLFDLEEAEKSPGWLVSLRENGATIDHGESDEYGVTSFVHRSRKPFHPERLHGFLAGACGLSFAEDWSAVESGAAFEQQRPPAKPDPTLGAILRSKGTCWIAGRDDHEVSWAQVGRIVQLAPGPAWLCETPEEEWEEGSLEERASKKQELFEGDTGDRRNEIVVIGTNLNQAKIEAALNTCLLTDREMSAHSVQPGDLPHGAYLDPLPRPVLAECGGARSFSAVSRPGLPQHLRVVTGFSLTIQNLALVYDGDDAKIRAVRVWLDASDKVGRGVLLATLRPLSCEQHAPGLVLLPHHDPGVNQRIRIEVVGEGGCSLCEVHATGKIEPLPYAEDADDEGQDGEDDAGDDE